MTFLTEFSGITMAFHLRVLVQANSAEEVGAEKQQLRSSPPSSGCPPSGGSLCIHFFTQHILSRPLTLVHPLHSTWLADPISSETLVFFFFFSVPFLKCLLNFYNIVSVLCFGVLPRCMWDLSYPTRDQTCAPCIGR